jgi:hypothetical protein
LLLIAGTLLARRRGSDATAPLAIGLASVGAIPFVLQRADPVHIESVAIVAYGLLPLAWVVLANRFRQSPVRRRACALVAFFAVLFGVGLFVAELVGSDILLVTHRSFYADGVDVKSRGRTFILGNRREAEASQSVLSVTDRLARPGDTVFVGPYDLRRAVYGPTYLYFLLPQLRPASYFMQFAPWTANRPGSSLARDILRADWIILVSKWDQIHEPNASSRLGPALPNQLVRSRFCLLIHDGSYRLFERRQPAARCERTVRRRLMRDASRASS